MSSSRRGPPVAGKRWKIRTVVQIIQRDYVYGGRTESRSCRVRFDCGHEASPYDRWLHVGQRFRCYQCGRQEPDTAPSPVASDQPVGDEPDGVMRLCNLCGKPMELLQYQTVKTGEHISDLDMFTCSCTGHKRTQWRWTHSTDG